MAAIFSQAFCPSGAAEPGLGQAPAAGMVQGSRQRCHHPVSSPECHSSVPRGPLCGAEAQGGLGEPLPTLPKGWAHLLLGETGKEEKAAGSGGQQDPPCPSPAHTQWSVPRCPVALFAREAGKVPSPPLSQGGSHPARRDSSGSGMRLDWGLPAQPSPSSVGG